MPAVTTVENRKEYLRQWYLTRKDVYKERHLYRQYGLTIDDLVSLMEDQNNLCAICKTDLTLLNAKNVHIDHCHNTQDMKIRGILCNKCNMALGLLNDDISLFKSCIKYLENASGN